MYRIQILKVFQFLPYVIFFKETDYCRKKEVTFNEKDSEHCAFLTIKQNLTSTLLPIKKNFFHIYFKYSFE